MLKFGLVSAAVLLAATPAAAQKAVDTNPLTAKETDANKIVCQKQEQVGSRLAVKKVCLTVKEWRERAQADREETERVQSGARVPGAGG